MDYRQAMPLKPSFVKRLLPKARTNFSYSYKSV